MSASLALVPVIPLLWILTIILFTLGVWEGALDVGVNLLLVWIHRKNANPFLNALHFFFGVGSFLGPILVAQILRINAGIQWAFWIMALYPLALIPGLLRQPSPKIHQENNGNGVNHAPNFQVFLVALFFALYVGAEAGFGGWIYSYALNMNLDSNTGSAFLTSAFWGAITIGRLASIPLASRLRPMRILSMNLCGSLVAVSLMILFSESRLVLWAGTILLGLFLASIFPTMLAFAGKRMPLTGNITRWFFVGAGAGGMFLPWLIGILFETISPRWTLLAIIMDLILAIIVFFWSSTYHKAHQTSN
jgi:FHS family Na+ dependent glucose MFS transporter 1